MRQTQPPPSALDKPALETNAIGAWDLVFFVVAAAAPLTVLAGVAPIAIAVAGPGAAAGYLVSGLALLLFAVGFTAMSRHVKNAGAFYAYVAQGLGRPAGVGAALVALLSYLSIGIGLYGALGSFAETTIADVFGLRLPWWVYAMTGIGLVWYLGFRRITLSAKVLGVALLAEVLVLLALAVAVIARGTPEGLTLAPFAPGNVFTPGFAGALGVTFAAYIGFEATAIFGEEARDATRSVRRATYIAIAFLALFYTFVAWIVVVAFGPSVVGARAGKNTADLVFIATGDYAGQAAVTVMHLLIVTSAFAAILAFHNAASRYFFALGRERVLPAAFARVHPRTRSPWVAGVVGTALAVVVVAGFAVAGLDPFLNLLIWVNTPGIAGIMVLQALCSFAVAGFYRRRPDLPASGWTRRYAPLLGGLALTVATYLATSHIDLLTGLDATANTLLLAPLPLIFALGVLIAVRIRAKDPTAYAHLTTTNVEQEAERQE